MRVVVLTAAVAIVGMTGLLPSLAQPCITQCNSTWITQLSACHDDFLCKLKADEDQKKCAQTGKSCIPVPKPPPPPPPQAGDGPPQMRPLILHNGAPAYGPVIDPPPAQQGIVTIFESDDSTGGGEGKGAGAGGPGNAVNGGGHICHELDINVCGKQHKE